MFFMVSCSEDDGTGNSLVEPTSPALLITLGFTNSQTLIESEEVYPFTITLSEPQVADVTINLEQTAGTATEGEDFSFPHQVIIEAGKTSASGEIAIHEDELIEDTETVTIKIAANDIANVASFNSPTVTFNIMNLTDGDLNIGMSWDITGFQFPDGSPFDPTDLADLVMYVTTSPDLSNIVDTEDGAGFESYTLTADSPDGDYYIIAGWFEAADLGDQGDFSVELNINLDQVGVINHDTYTFSDALNSGLTCENAYYITTKITKSGENYIIEEVAESSISTADISGTYNVISNGESTDSKPTNNPLVNFASTVTITQTGVGTYELSDGWAGVYIEWYSIYGNTEEEPQTLYLDVCNELNAEWTDIFGGGQTLTGKLNEDGTLTIRVDNVYGDYVDAVYTLQ